jgi:S-DNA-T family DNA segregation ATPase FtsK/SpoIIIE
MGKQQQSDTGHAREIWAVVLVGLSLLLLLSLASHNPYDVGNAARPAGQAVSNFIGPVGAWLSFLVFQAFGLAGYVLMLVLAGLGVVLLLGHEIPWRSKIGAGVLLVVASTCLLHLADLKLAIARWSLPASAGGFVGLFVGGFFQSLLGKAGTWIIFGVLYIISLIILVNLRPSYWVALAADAARDGWRKMRGQPSVKDELAAQERELRLKGREIERDLVRTGREAKKLAEEEAKPALPAVEPKIKDWSDPAAAPKKAEEPAKPKKPSMVEKLAEKLTPEKEKEQEKEKEDGPAVPVVDKTTVIAPVATAKPKSEKPLPPPPPPAPVQTSFGPYTLPALDLLEAPPAGAPRTATVVEDAKLNAEILRQTLLEFGIEVQVTEVTKGPVVTLYEVVPAAGVKVEKITALSNNIGLAMKAVTVRIIAPVPGKGTVGIEVPNPKSAVVYLRDILESEEYRHVKARIPIVLGRDVGGNAIIGDLADMPHMLIAGATGSGKTVCVNAILASLLYRFGPDDLRLVLVDPKMVEMHQYNGLPHLVVPVVTEAKKVTLALRWCINEMEKRFQILAKAGVRNIASFNTRKREKPKPAESATDANGEKKPAAQQEVFKIEVPREDELIIPDKLPYIVVVIDELADLMQQAGADIENAIARLTALSRAVGIHLIIATQRPSVDVITGVIKANIPARCAFQVASKQDSRVVLDANGADKLLGKGDMLYLPPGSSKLIRAQGVWVQDAEIVRLCEFISKQSPQQFVPEIHSKISKKMILPSDMSDEDAEDEALVEQSIEVIRQTQRASVSVLQRRLRIGYTRAARIMDLLEERGVVGPGKGAEPRDILMDLDQRAQQVITEPPPEEPPTT